MTIEFDEIVAFVRQEVRPPNGLVLAAQTDLRGDLRMLGEDADELLARFAERFRVAPGDFELERYFPPEGLWLLRLRKSAPPPRLTLGMLLQAARDGTWRTAALELQGRPR